MKGIEIITELTHFQWPGIVNLGKLGFKYVVDELYSIILGKCKAEVPSISLSQHSLPKIRITVLSDDDNTGTFCVFQMWIGMYEVDHCIFTLLKQQRERREKFRPEWGFEP